MPLGEFELIERFFRVPAEMQRQRRGDVPLGIGDDAALLTLPPGQQLVAALDTLVEGRHFLPGAPPDSIGHRALAINLSDLAAMGAVPTWFLLSLTLPSADEAFLSQFSRGMLALAEAHDVALVGGNTTGGPLVIAVQALGHVAPGTALTRGGGRAGDLLYVSGTPGDAAAGLRVLRALQPGVGDARAIHYIDAATAGDCMVTAAHRDALVQRFLFPTPRVALGQALRGIASACIDVSDGLAADAARLAAASGCAVRIEAESLPLSPALRAMAGLRDARHSALTGGEDCELCFTVPPQQVRELERQLDIVKCTATRIGQLEVGQGVRVTEGGATLDIDLSGWDHFANP